MWEVLPVVDIAAHLSRLSILARNQHRVVNRPSPCGFYGLGSIGNDDCKRFALTCQHLRDAPHH